MKRFFKKAISLLCALTAAVYAAPVHAEGFVLTETASGEVIAHESQSVMQPVAGLVRLMSLLIILEDIDSGTIKTGDEVTVSASAAAKTGTQVFLDEGEKCEVETLLKAAVMCGANDATAALAEHCAGSEDAFVERMNKRAEELGVMGRFTDCAGLDETMLCASDVAIISAELARHALFFKYSTLFIDTFIHDSGRETEMVNANRLVKSGVIDGMGTSSSADAGYCISATQKQGAARFICVVLGAQKSDERFAQAQEALAGAAAAYTVRSFAKKGGKVTTAQAGGRDIDVYAAEDLVILLKKGEEAAAKQELRLEEITLPIAAGTKVGELAAVLADGSERSTALVVKEEVRERTFASALKEILALWV